MRRPTVWTRQFFFEAPLQAQRYGIPPSSPHPTTFGLVGRNIKMKWFGRISNSISAGVVPFVWHLLVLSRFLWVTSAGGDENGPITCGSAIKLSHVEAKSSSGQAHFLNSEGKNLGGGSGQQIVTSIASPTTTNTLWWIRGPHDVDRYPFGGGTAACRTQGVAEPIQCGQVIRLTHLETLRNLHSHNVRSPLSQQQEVSAYGEGDGTGDNGDDWKVVCNGKYWERSTMVSFQHVDSGHYLGSSSTVKFSHQNCGHSCPIMNHLEVFGRNSKDNYGVWVVEMGVHISK